jgi:hypothetical protein
MKLPEKLNRRAVKANFDKVPGATWEYLFDHEKENGLGACRTTGWSVKQAFYATKPLIQWLIDRGYYTPADFKLAPDLVKSDSPWAVLNVRRHAIAA